MKDRCSLDLTALPRFDERSVNLVWSMDWWDGPLNGLVDIDGKRHWFEFVSEDESGREYRYLVFPLTLDQVREIDGWREKNKRWQTEWTERYSRDDRASSAEAKRFADDWKQAIPELHKPIEEAPVAWFSSGTNAAFYAVQISDS